MPKEIPKMTFKRTRVVALAMVGACLTAASAMALEPKANLIKGTPDLKSAGQLAFGPDGILFVGDTKGAALFAIQTDEAANPGEKRPIEVADVTGKIAAALGVKANQIIVNDLAVNPRSGSVYLSVSRGLGPEAAPVLVRINSDGKLEEFSLANVGFSKAELPNVADSGNARNESITDLAFADGRVFVAGVSNEEWSSRLIAIPYPFSAGGFDGGAIEIYHGAHGKFETKSPIRTFVTYKLREQPYMLAAYQCTPLVKLPVSDLKAGAHVKGTTIAELGNRNRPLDMIAYHKDGKDYLLLSNSSRGVMKIPTDGAADAAAITDPVGGGGTKGLGYDKVETLKGVVQMDQLDDKHAVILQQEARGPANLKTIELP
jgi:hypothetical protein